MNPMPEIIPMLKQLRLSSILETLESRNRQAIESKLASAALSSSSGALAPSMTNDQ